MQDDYDLIDRYGVLQFGHYITRCYDAVNPRWIQWARFNVPRFAEQHDRAKREVVRMIPDKYLVKQQDVKNYRLYPKNHFMFRRNK
jgi:hypothetical protein